VARILFADLLVLSANPGGLSRRGGVAAFAVDGGSP
jgi:hypothetical protein